MPLPKPLSKEQVLAAMGATLSNMAAARYLHVSYQHYRKYAKLYKDEATGKNLLELHKNQCGKGIPKFLTNRKKDPALMDIIEGRVDSSHFTPEKIKHRLIEEGYLKEECSVCGFSERRVLDYKIPLLLHFKDGNKKNYRPENVELLCYNDYFLQVGDVFNEPDIKSMESQNQFYKTSDKITWEVDEYHLKRLKELGLENEEKNNPGSEFIVRI